MTDPSPWTMTLTLIVLESALDERSRATLVESLHDWPDGSWTLVDDVAPREVADALGAVSTALVGIVHSPFAFTANAYSRLTAWLDEGERDLVTFDEWTIGVEGMVLTSRPIFSPERLRCQQYLGDFVIWRTDFIRQLGGYRDLPGAELHDLLLRAARSGLRPMHIPEALMSRRATTAELDDVALASIRVALEEHLEHTGGGRIDRLGADGIHETRRLVSGEPLVSIVIPSRGLFVTGESGRSHLVDAVRSIMERSTYRAFELVVVIDDVAEKDVIAEVEDLAGDKLTWVWWSEAFNFSAKVNAGVLRSRGDYVLMLNDDIDVISPDWIESLLALAQIPGAGMSGAMLYYEDDTIQHAGHTYYLGDASHIGMYRPRGSDGPLSGYRVEREIAGVTAACAMMPRSVFYEVGGLSTLLASNFNDVDLCMKVTAQGHAIYWTPHAELYHFESKTRDASVHAYEVETAWGRWGHRMHEPDYWPYPLDGRP